MTCVTSSPRGGGCGPGWNQSPGLGGQLVHPKPATPGDGFGCGGATPVHVANASLPAMAPVCSDHYDTGCALATEEQVAGLYGGVCTGFYYGFGLYSSALKAQFDLTQQQLANINTLPCALP